MQIKQAILYPIRKLFTIPFLTSLLAGLLKRSPSSKILRGICPNQHLFSNRAIKKVKRKGMSFELRLSDYMDWLLYFHSDADSSAPVLEYAKQGDTVLDIGGNIGQTALFMAKKTSPGGVVISFEPFPETYKRFLTNLQLNPGINNLVVENIALGNSHAKLKMLAENTGNSGQNRILNENNPADAVIEVDVMPLSSYLHNKPLDRIDLIKIDVEGFEYNVLKGASDVLKKYRPLLYIELSEKNLNQQGSSASEVVRLLNELSYDVKDVASGKTIKDMTFGHTDVICFPSKNNGQFN
jgi:FkbM family methyltransferase